MNSKNPLFWLLIIVSILTMQTSNAMGELAEVVWVESSELQNQILYSEYAEGAWLEPGSEIYSTEESILTPFIITDSDGSKLVIWSESRDENKMVLMMMRGKLVSDDSTANLVWADPSQLPVNRDYNVGAVAIVDSVSDLWVFWTAENDEDSDIFQARYENGSWSDLQMAHASNAVPDLSPEVRLDARGDIKLSWSSYSFETHRYEPQEKRISPLGISKSELARAKKSVIDHQDVSSNSIALPNFLPSRSQLIRLHFPQNRKVQFQNLSR